MVYPLTQAKLSLETLHQTFELIKTILGRISKSCPDLSKAPNLESTLYEIEKFSRRSAKNYRTKLSDDLLSDLSDLLVPFDLDLTIEDEVQYLKTVKESTSDTSALKLASDAPKVSRTEAVAQPKVRNTFAEMMKKASSQKVSALPASTQMVKQAKPVGSGSKYSPVDIDNFDDDFLSNISSSDLEIIEERAQVSSGAPSAPLPMGLPHKPPRPQQPLPNLSINVVQKYARSKAVGGASFKSKVMKDMRREHYQQLTERKRYEIGGIVPKLPVPSALGTGLGAYQGERRKVQPVENSGSSDSESSSEIDSKGIVGLIKRQKSPKKLAMPTPTERRPIKLLGAALEDIARQREDRRASQNSIKQRLRPDMNPLYRYVLAWNPDHIGPLAPHPPKYSAELSALSPVPTTFSDSKRYEQVMLPLYLQELWSQCIKDQPTSASVRVEVSSRTYEDDFLDMELTVQGSLPNDFYAQDTDVVLLRQPDAQPVLAKVQGFRRRFKDVALKVRILVMMDRKELAGRSKWQLQKHIS